MRKKDYSEELQEIVDNTKYLVAYCPIASGELNMLTGFIFENNIDFVHHNCQHGIK